MQDKVAELLCVDPCDLSWDWLPLHHTIVAAMAPLAQRFPETQTSMLRFYQEFLCTPAAVFTYLEQASVWIMGWGWGR